MANGITIGGLELTENGYYFEIIQGGLDDIPEYRGEDDVVPEAAGMAAGLWTKHRRILKLHGTVEGSGATQALRRVSYRSRFDALVAKMDVATPIDVVVYGPREGLGAGDTATLADCRPQRIIGPASTGDEIREVTLELVCIGSPPDWLVDIAS